jgi:glycosyltransferase involved in cell wall biosynthesis
MACGLPVVATAVGGIPEQVEDGVTGFLVPPGDEKVMIAAVKRLLTDESLRCRLGENAANDAQKRFDLERQVDEYLEWYEEICHNSTASDRLGEPCIPQI